MAKKTDLRLKLLAIQRAIKDKKAKDRLQFEAYVVKAGKAANKSISMRASKLKLFVVPGGGEKPIARIISAYYRPKGSLFHKPLRWRTLWREIRPGFISYNSRRRGSKHETFV